MLKLNTIRMTKLILFLYLVLSTIATCNFFGYKCNEDIKFNVYITAKNNISILLSKDIVKSHYPLCEQNYFSYYQFTYSSLWNSNVFTKSCNHINCIHGRNQWCLTEKNMCDGIFVQNVENKLNVFSIHGREFKYDYPYYIFISILVLCSIKLMAMFVMSLREQQKINELTPINNELSDF